LNNDDHSMYVLNLRETLLSFSPSSILFLSHPFSSILLLIRFGYRTDVYFAILIYLFSSLLYSSLLCLFHLLPFPLSFIVIHFFELCIVFYLSSSCLNSLSLCFIVSPNAFFLPAFDITKLPFSLFSYFAIFRFFVVSTFLSFASSL